MCISRNAVLNVQFLKTIIIIVIKSKFINEIGNELNYIAQIMLVVTIQIFVAHIKGNWVPYLRFVYICQLSQVDVGFDQFLVVSSIIEARQQFLVVSSC